MGFKTVPWRDQREPASTREETEDDVPANAEELKLLMKQTFYTQWKQVNWGPPPIEHFTMTDW